MLSKKALLFSCLTFIYNMRTIAFLLFAVLTLTACRDTVRKHAFAPIKLGDSATIVTETDPQYLESIFEDFIVKPTASEEKSKTTEPEKPKDTIAESVQKHEPGLEVKFEDLTVLVEGIEVRQSYDKIRKSAAFTLTKGKLSQGKIKILKGNINKVFERYHTEIVVKFDKKEYNLDKIPGHSTDWKLLKGKADITISDFSETKLEHTKVSASTIRSAVRSAGRAAKFNRKNQSELERSVRRVKAPTNDPCAVVLKWVVWQFEGKDAQGNTIRRELRIDMP